MIQMIEDDWNDNKFFLDLKISNESAGEANLALIGGVLFWPR